MKHLLLIPFILLLSCQRERYYKVSVYTLLEISGNNPIVLVIDGEDVAFISSKAFGKGCNQLGAYTTMLPEGPHVYHAYRGEQNWDGVINVNHDCTEVELE